VLRVRPEAREIGGKISLLAAVPLHPAEIRLKLDHGSSALVEAFDRAGINELVDPRRPSSV
jgi:hypothetical protein